MARNVIPLTNLIEQFERMPGIGHKSAQKLAFYILGMSDDEVKRFAENIILAKQKIHHCKVCCDLTDSDICSICSDERRDRSVICVVESSKDVIAIERTREYNGLYHVLHGSISPMNGIGPDEITIKELLSRLSDENIRKLLWQQIRLLRAKRQQCIFHVLLSRWVLKSHALHTVCRSVPTLNMLTK